MCLLDELRVVIDSTERTGILHDSAEEFGTEVELLPLPEDDLDTLRSTAGEDDVTCRGEDVLVDEELACFGLDLGLGALVEEQEGGLSTSGSFVEQGAVAQGQGGQVGDDGLEVEERLQTTLRDLSLIGGIGGIPYRALQDIALDDGWQDCVVPALPYIRGVYFVLGS